MHDASDIPWDLIADTLAGEQRDGNGERPGAERDALERWLDEQPAHRRLFAMAQSVWETDPSWTAPDVAMLKAKVSACIGVDVDQYKERTDRQEWVFPLAPRGRDSERQPRGIFKKQPLRGTKWSTIAGVVATVGLLLMGSWKLASWGSTKELPTMTTYATMNGERATITLPDGSHVTLGVASQLDVPTDFARRDRTLRLKGEAVFAVAHQGGMPFTVVAGATVARVLGTTFLVRRYATDTTTVVAVREGKVAVRSVVLAATQQISVSLTGQTRLQPADAALFTFTTGVLTLEDMTLAHAIAELDRWYDVDIRLGDPALAMQGIGGKFLAGSVSDLAALLEMTFDVRVVRDGRVLTLYPRR